MDDSLLIGDSEDTCSRNVQDRCYLMKRLGLLLTQPSQSETLHTIWGFVINTVDMSVCLPTRKISSTVTSCFNLVNQKQPTIWLVSQVFTKLLDLPLMWISVIIDL